jgi:hypothetical protein
MRKNVKFVVADSIALSTSSGLRMCVKLTAVNMVLADYGLKIHQF